MSPLKSLSPGYQLEIRQLSNSDWSALICNFSDATLYQSRSYGSVRWSPACLEHAVLMKDATAIAMAQVTIVRVPLLRCGFAYIPWGPLWKKSACAENVESLRQLSRGLIREYVHNRGLLLRMIPNDLDVIETPLRSILEEEGFRRAESKYRTLILDLSPTLEEIRKGLAQKWRNQLNRSEKNGLTITESTDVAQYDKFMGIYRQMMDRKIFDTDVSIDQFHSIQNDLPDSFRMRVFLCEHDGETVAGAVCSAIGNMGIYLLGATNDHGMQAKGSYLLQWHIIQWLKSRGCQIYDLGGIDPEANPGVYHFKSGISSKEARQIGTFELCSNLRSSLAVGFREKFLPALRQFHPTRKKAEQAS
jgi:hypothetical protein